jgi:hypothetical protein
VNFSTSPRGAVNIHLTAAAKRKNPPADIDLLTLKKMIIEDI